MRVEFEPIRHKYAVFDGEKQIHPPSVTTITGIIDKSGALTNWAANCASAYWREAIQPGVPYSEMVLEIVYEQARKAHREKKQEAADIGTEVHRTLEGYFREGQEPVDPDARVRSCFDAARSWLQEHQVEKLAVERRVYTRKHRCIGTLDKLAIVDGELAIVDWKSSNGLYKDYICQISAYKGFYEEETGEKIKKAYLIRLDKQTGEPEPHEFNRTQLGEAYKTFLAALRLYRGLQAIKN